MFGRRRGRGGRYWGFFLEFVRNKGVGARKGQGVLGEAGAGWERFRVIQFSISEGAANGAEADDVVGGGVHVDDHGREEEEVSDGVIVVVGAAWLGALALS